MCAADLSELELPAERGGCEADAANRELYGQLLDSVAALHQRQLTLSDGDCRQLQQLVGSWRLGRRLRSAVAGAVRGRQHRHRLRQRQRGHRHRRLEGGTGTTSRSEMQLVRVTT